MEEGREVKVFKFSEVTLCMDSNGDESLLYVGTNAGNVLVWNLNSIRPAPAKVNFDRVAVDSECSTLVSV